MGGVPKQDGASRNLSRADDVRVTCPLFQAEYGGSTPTSALQLRFSRTDIHRALVLNEEWHSRMPKLTNWQGCIAYTAEAGNVVYAVAIWGRPVAREFNGRGYIELRRMAVADDAPKNTATRMIGWMLRELKKGGEYTLAISYQDTGVHKGTIYKASGWTAAAMKKNIGTGWNTRDRNSMQSTSDKVRWEYSLAGRAAGAGECPKPSDEEPKSANDGTLGRDERVPAKTEDRKP